MEQDNQEEKLPIQKNKGNLFPAKVSDDNSALKKVRDILVGGQIKEYDSRFAELEDLIKSKAENINKDTKSQFATLEVYIKDEFEKLKKEIEENTKKELDLYKNSFTTEKKERDRAMENFSTDIGKLREEINQHIIENSNDLKEELYQKIDELSELINTKNEKLLGNKLEKAHMSILLKEMADKLDEKK